MQEYMLQQQMNISNEFEGKLHSKNNFLIFLTELEYKQEKNLRFRLLRFDQVTQGKTLSTGRSFDHISRREARTIKIT